MRKKLLLVSTWLPISLISLIASLTFLHATATISEVKEIDSLFVSQAREMLPKNSYQFYAALPQVLGSFNQAIEMGDARPELIRQFLDSHNSPLEPYVDNIIEQSDEHVIDFRLITAIAMCESNLGKKIPEGSFNAWGYAIYTGQKKGVEFDGWKEAIAIMAKYLDKKYYQKGLINPEEIGPIYAPPSVGKDNSWAKCVRKFMEELE